MPPKNKKTVEIPPVEDIEILEETLPSDDEIQAPPAPAPKAKRTLTEKQKEALAKGRDACHARTKLKDLKEEKIMKKNEVVKKAKKEIEDSIIKTAVKLKKKQLVEEARLAQFVEDDQEEIPDAVIKNIIKNKKIQKPILYRNEPEPEHYSPYYFL